VNVHHPETSVELGRSLLRALNNTGISVLYQDPQLRVLWAQNVPPSWSTGDLFGATDEQFLPETEAQRVIGAKKAVLESGHPQSLEIHVPAEGGTKWFNIWIDADRNENSVGGVVTTAVDITEQKRREQTLRTLLREVSHRSKNLLAIIQSIATQTGRYSGTIEGFLTRFRGRLQSLASSQDLVTSSNWRGADLHELITSQVARYSADPDQSVRMEGVNPFLNPNAALHIGLALHELAVNSVSYGALSRPEGHVTLAAHLVPRDANQSRPRALELVWTETIPPGEAGGGVKNKRFGSVALERVVPASLDGTATLAVGPGRLEYRLLVPEGSYEID
jgi:two-component sensor histidine kinase